MTSSSNSDSHFAAGEDDSTDGPPSDDDDEHASVLRELTPGTVVGEKYRVEEVLGSGGMGVVVAAKHLELGELVALKFLLSSTDRKGRARFMREAKVCARLRNEHITRVLDVGTHKRWPYMVMEHLSGRDLRSILRESKQLPLAIAVDYAVQLCEGLAEAHAHSIVHRDLKPTNLFITRRPDGSELLKILDFGISKWRVETDLKDDLTKTGVILGTPRYMAPEQLLGSNTVDARADVWSVGAIVYELIAGKPPYDQPSFAHVCAALANGRPPPTILEHGLDVPSEFEAVIMRCLDPDVARRVQNVAQLAGELLEASGASIAPEIRARITAVLEGNTPSPAHSASAPYATLVRAVATAREAPWVPAATTTPTRSRAPIVITMIALVALVAWLGLRATRPHTPAVAAPAPPPPAAPSATTIQLPPAPSPSASLPPTVAVVASPPAASSSPKKIFAKPVPVPSATVTAAPPEATPAPAASPTAPKHPWDDRL